MPNSSTISTIPVDALIARFQEAHWLLGTAESCSGGLIAHWLTNVAGVSSVYAGGVVTYSNALKRQLLGVQDDTLDKQGAVSEATAREMALGARNRLAVDWSIAVTGIAGPGGGTPEKPVGLVYMGVAGPDDALVVARFQFGGDRESIKAQTATAALELLWNTLQETMTR